MKADLAKLRALLAKFPGPWKMDESFTDSGGRYIGIESSASGVFEDVSGQCGMNKEAAELVIFAINALPDLIAELTRLRAIAEAVERDAKRLDALEAMGYSYGFEDMHEGHCWKIEGPYPNVRAALDAAIDRILAIGEDG